MKQVFLLLLLLLPFLGTAQSATDECVDVVYLKGGSVYRGKIIEQPADGPLVMQTWNGLTVHLAEKKVKRVVQKCPETGNAKTAHEPKPYSFREKGWYNSTHASFLAGKTWSDDVATGFSLHNSTGYAFSRWIAVGLGLGVDGYSPYRQNINQPTYPVFAEVRGYLLPQTVSPFYVAGAGWGIAGGTKDRQGYEERWTGGWMAKFQLGYRLGNNFCMFGGLRFQRQNRVWENVWDSSHGKDRILHQRFELGFGLLL